MFREDERLVRIAEGLGEHHHHHRYLEARAVDTELRLCICAGVEIREEDAVESLVHDACHAEYQQRQRVAQHLFEYRCAELSAFRHCERQEAERLDRRRQDVTEEDIEHIVLAQDY